MKTYTIYEMLDRIRGRPAMYVGSTDLSSVGSYISGYMIAMKDAGIKDASNPVFQGFHEFIRAKYDFSESTAGWGNMITAVVIGLSAENIRWEGYDDNITFDQQKKAMSMFYELLDEYRAINP